MNNERKCRTLYKNLLHSNAQPFFSKEELCPYWLISKTRNEQYKYQTLVFFETFYSCSGVQYFYSTHLRSMEHVVSIPYKNFQIRRLEKKIKSKLKGLSKTFPMGDRFPFFMTSACCKTALKEQRTSKFEIHKLALAFSILG